MYILLSFLFLPLSLSLSLSRFTKPKQFGKSDNNGSESPPGERRGSSKRSSFTMSAGTGGRRRAFNFRVGEKKTETEESKVRIIFNTFILIIGFSHLVFNINFIV